MIWLIGCKGMLGTELSRQLEASGLPWVGTDREIDITDAQALEAFAKGIETEAYTPSALPHEQRHIQWIVNCSAYTNVDKAEEEPDLAEKLNVLGVMNIARLTRKINAKLIHISTDYVFNGKESAPYTEDMPKDPLGVYGRTKSDGEDIIKKEMNQYYILRTAWLYGYDGKNFVYTMTKLMNDRDSIKVVADQFGTPTCAADLAETIIKIIQKGDNAKSFFGRNSALSYGIYHFTDEGRTSWHEFATEIYRLGRKYGRIVRVCDINPCTTAEYGAKVQRPACSVLSKEKITKALKLKIPSWQASLEKFIKNGRFNPL